MDFGGISRRSRVLSCGMLVVHDTVNSLFLINYIGAGEKRFLKQSPRVELSEQDKKLE